MNYNRPIIITLLAMLSLCASTLAHGEAAPVLPPSYPPPANDPVYPTPNPKPTPPDLPKTAPNYKPTKPKKIPKPGKVGLPGVGTFVEVAVSGGVMLVDWVMTDGTQVPRQYQPQALPSNCVGGTKLFFGGESSNQCDSYSQSLYDGLGRTGSVHGIDGIGGAYYDIKVGDFIIGVCSAVDFKGEHYFGRQVYCSAEPLPANAPDDDVAPDVAPQPSPSPSPSDNPAPSDNPNNAPSDNPNKDNPSPSPSPTTPPDVAPNDVDGGGNASNFELPAFCSWASKVCNWIDWTMQDDDFGGDHDLDIEDKPLTKSPNDFDVMYLRFGGQCPAPVTHNLGLNNATFTIDLTPLCQFAILVRPAILAMAYFLAIGIIANAIRDT